MAIASRAIDQSLTEHHPCLHLQEQFVFVHDAILESLTCGDTQITPSDVRTQITKLGQREPQLRMTGFESQFKVSQLPCLPPLKWFAITHAVACRINICIIYGVGG